MEVDGLGARCALSTCGTLDYLPYRCNHCRNQFCASHSQPSAHKCTAPTASTRDVPTCPLCLAPVPRHGTESADIAVSRHIDAGCPRRVRNNPLCSKQACGKRDPASTHCATCKKVFCLSHRLEQDHDCISPSTSSKSSHRTKRMGRSEKRTSPVAAQRNSRPELHVIPQRRLDFVNNSNTAIGDGKIPVEERVPLAVFFPAGSGVKPRHMFFSQKSSAGRIIDYLRKEISQIPHPKENERYYLYAVKKNGGGVNLLPYITPLKDLPRDLLQPGDFVVMENGDGGLDQQWLASLSSGPVAPTFGSSRRNFRTKSTEKCVVS